MHILTSCAVVQYLLLNKYFAQQDFEIVYKVHHKIKPSKNSTLAFKMCQMVTSFYFTQNVYILPSKISLPVTV